MEISEVQLRKILAVMNGAGEDEDLLDELTEEFVAEYAELTKPHYVHGKAYEDALGHHYIRNNYESSWSDADGFCWNGGPIPPIRPLVVPDGVAGSNLP
jgi:hypothetical protein